MWGKIYEHHHNCATVGPHGMKSEYMCFSRSRREKCLLLIASGLSLTSKNFVNQDNAAIKLTKTNKIVYTHIKSILIFNTGNLECFSF